MRPSPADVAHWFSTEVTSEALTAYLSVLTADPNWRVNDQMGTSLRTLLLLYGPSGALLDVVLIHVNGRWHVRASLQEPGRLD